MIMDGTNLEGLLRDLDHQHAAYLETFSQIHQLLAQNVAATVPRTTLLSGTESESQRSQRSNRQSVAGAAMDRGLDPRKTPTGFPSITDSSNSRNTGNESDSDEDADEALYVQTPLEPVLWDMEALRNHLKTHPWGKHTRDILDGVVGNPDRLSEMPLIPNRRGRLPDNSDLTHFQVFDVGADGCPLPVDFSHIERDHGRSMALWHAIREINPPSKVRQAVGRITVIREPSPILFGAIHYTMNTAFDVDELLGHLYTADVSSASLDRSFEEDPRRQRSYIFNFEYFTMIGKDCEPMKWQLSAGQEDRKPNHISITRCSSVVALVLNGDKIKDVKNPARRKQRNGERGPVFDPFSSWQVLNLQAYPDVKASLDLHDSTKHYANGPEAFMTTILGEYRDAYRRFSDITKRISKRVRPPLEFMFDSALRDKLLFEDDEYSMARRYFWAHQTLGIMNESIKALIDAFEEGFPAEVWDGTHKSLWPLLDPTSTRNMHYKKKMAALRAEFEIVLKRLARLIDENNDRRQEIQDLREDLFTGTSIQESRKSVNATEITVLQGHNIKILTLVSIFFLPLTFVTSVFGMTNMPTDKHYWMFAIVTTTVCVPFFLLIGSLSSTRGFHFWKRRLQAAFSAVQGLFGWVTGRKRGAETPELLSIKSFDSQQRSDTIRLRRHSSLQNQTERKMPGRAITSEDRISRDDGDRRLDTSLALAGSMSPAMRPTFPVSTASKSESRIASMMIDERERKRRLTYQEV